MQAKMLGIKAKIKKVSKISGLAKMLKLTNQRAIHGVKQPKRQPQQMTGHNLKVHKMEVGQAKAVKITTKNLLSKKQKHLKTHGLTPKAVANQMEVEVGMPQNKQHPPQEEDGMMNL